MIPKGTTPEGLNAFCDETMVSHLGIQFTEVGEDYICANMPVNQHTRQPMGLLHGGASVALAETLGSVAAALIAGMDKSVVGLEINANHIRAKKEGIVTGKATPLHIGRTTQLWEIRITDEDEKLICISKITMAILEKKIQE
nr:hotdog fold thioesterase [Marinoscillum furvescens]